MNRARAAERHDGVDGFEVHLTNFEGPFDLLLQLISRRELDVTEVALSQVTDEFIAHVRTAGQGWDLEKTSAFLVVASTLLDGVAVGPDADVPPGSVLEVLPPFAGG